MLNARKRTSWSLLLLGIAACGSDPVELSEEPLDEPPAPLDEPAPPLTGVVIATDTIGKLLVLSMREVLAGLQCPSRNFVTECGTMVVLEQDGPIPGRRPGRLTVSGPNPVTYYPWSDFTLAPEAQDI